MQHLSLQEFLRPDGIDKHGPLYLQSSVNKSILKLIMAEDYFHRGAKKVSVDIQKATEYTDQAAKNFSAAIERYAAVKDHFIESSKKSSAEVRAATEKLAQGLAKIEKAANFERLEKYAGLLERSAAALSVLAELEKTGKLEKIMQAIK